MDKTKAIATLINAGLYCRDEMYLAEFNSIRVINMYDAQEVIESLIELVKVN